MTKPDGLRLGADAIVAAAEEILIEEGLDAVSMRSVSARLGVSPIPLYSRIGNKDDLLDAVTDHLLANLAPAIRAGERWVEYAARWAGEIRRRLQVAADSRLILRASRHHYVEASRPLISLMRAEGLGSDLAVQGCRQLVWAIVGFVALEGHQTRPSGEPRRRRPAGADPSGVSPGEIEELFGLQIRYLIEGIDRRTRMGESSTSGAAVDGDDRPARSD